MSVVGVANGQVTSRAEKSPGADGLPFEINVNGTKYYLYYDDWLKQQQWLKDRRGW